MFPEMSSKDPPGTPALLLVESTQLGGATARGVRLSLAVREVSMNDKEGPALPCTRCMGTPPTHGQPLRPNDADRHGYCLVLAAAKAPNAAAGLLLPPDIPRI